MAIEVVQSDQLKPSHGAISKDFIKSLSQSPYFQASRRIPTEEVQPTDWLSCAKQINSPVR